ncbi:ribulose-phosphate 3-epimerase [Peptoniphilus sp. GNH]|nr:ribulose-phosphate 3-epimerase [Clostridiales bacterium KA00134]UHR02986.1 ribulose-phosphate 3-epimerase [Peptoniphilus sp. GNH]
MLSPSILSCDFTKLNEEIDLLNRNKVDYIHLDIMDGLYVPNISFGPCVIEQVRKITDIALDVHLMIQKPEALIDEFIKAGADIITFHPDATTHPHRLIGYIKSKGVKVGLALNPHQRVEDLEYLIDELDLVLIMSVNPGFGGQSFIESSIEKIKKLRNEIDKRKLKTLIEVDGGIKRENAKRVLDAGADIVVIGSGIFAKEDKDLEIKKILEVIR